ncbi:MAG: glycoside hydrolase family 27 protein [Acidobacteriota bacterium]|nr:glycoside hydrolase family 27 protein [Acidobacteriota bacterium]
MVAPAPPMGWNSWDSYGLTITEAQFRDNVTILATQLAPFGWRYAVIDEGWFFANPEERLHEEKLIYALDPNGRYVPVPQRFPSSGQTRPAPAGVPEAGSGPTAPKLPVVFADTNFKALGEFVHAQGLRFGIHIVRGIPRASVERNLPIAGSAFHAADAADTSDACPWDPTNWGIKDTPAGQAWYDSLLTQYAGWGVDLLKVDCISDHPYKPSEIRMIRRAIDRSGRAMVLSLSPGPTALDHAAEVGGLSNMWRISDDFWDYWVTEHPDKTYPKSLSAQFATAASWAPYAKPGNWPDADMLPLGHLGPHPGEGRERNTRFTADEQHTLLTLWSMARSPLVLGANLTLLDDATRALITNRDVLAVDQTATASREALHSGGVIAWTADLPANFPGGYTTALALFNTGDSAVTVNSSFEAYNLPVQTYTARDAWTGKSLGKLKSVENLSLAPHASTLWLLHR